MIHVSGLKWRHVSIYSMQWEVFNLFDCISRWAVPVFVMISGALFLKSDKPIRVILRQNVSRLVVAYLAWGAFYAWLAHPKGIGAFLMLTLTGHFHMWYIPMIVGLYLMAPLLRPIARDDRLCRYFLLLSFVFAIGVPFAGKALALVSPYRSQQFLSLVGKLGLKNMVEFSLYFVLGYYLDNLQRQYPTRRLALLLAGALASIVVGTVLLSFAKGEAVDLLLGTFTPGDFAAAALVFLLARNLFEDFDPQDRPRGVALMRALSPLTLGVYLVHPFFIESLEKWFGTTTTTFEPILSVLLVFSLVTGVSFAFTALVSKIPILNRWII